MRKALSVARSKMEDVLEIEKNLTSYQVAFKNFSLDYLVITFYADFEKELNLLIEEKLKAGGDFSKNYSLFLKKRFKQLHGGIRKDTFKDLVENVFEKEIDYSEKDWQIYSSFISFRHSIAHDDSYDTAKTDLQANINGDISKVLFVLEKYIKILQA